MQALTLKLPIKPIKAITKQSLLKESISLSIFNEGETFVTIELDKGSLKLRQKALFEVSTASAVSFDDCSTNRLSLSVNNFDEIMNVISVDHSREMALLSDANAIRFQSYWLSEADNDVSRKMTSSFIINSNDFIAKYEYKGEVDESTICVFACKEVKAFVSSIPTSETSYQAMDIRYTKAGMPIKLHTHTPFYSIELVLATLHDPQHAYEGGVATAAEHTSTDNRHASGDSRRDNKNESEGRAVEEKTDQHALQS